MTKEFLKHNKNIEFYESYTFNALVENRNVWIYIEYGPKSLSLYNT